MKNTKQCFFIEDDLDDQDFYCEAIRMIDPKIECFFANDGTDALYQLTQNPDFLPDYIFMDMNMPKMNGLECLSLIREIPRLREVPVYVFSTAATPKTTEELFSLGVTDFLIKPSSVKELQSQLSQILLREGSASLSQ